METENKIKAARKSASLTQRQAADRVGVDTSTWCRIENAKQLPSREVVARIMDLLDLDADAVLFPDGKRAA